MKDYIGVAIVILALSAPFVIIAWLAVKLVKELIK